MRDWWWLLLLAGCAGFERECSASCASAAGADWVVVQYRFDGEPINCWKLTNVGVSNEASSDGIFWKGRGGHLVHISGWYNRVQVERGDFEGAAREVGVELQQCVGGRYRTSQ